MISNSIKALLTLLLIIIATDQVNAAIVPAQVVHQPSWGIWQSYNCISKNIPAQEDLAVCRSQNGGQVCAMRDELCDSTRHRLMRQSSCQAGVADIAGQSPGCYACPEGSTSVPGDVTKCEVPDEEPECPNGQYYDAVAGQCLPNNNCTIPGQSVNPINDNCECPQGQTVGYAGTVGTGLSQRCVTDQLPPGDCETPIGTVNGQPVCPVADSACPEGYNAGQVNDEWICVPKPDPVDCPAGTSYQKRHGIEQCWEDKTPGHGQEEGEQPDHGNDPPTAEVPTGQQEGSNDTAIVNALNEANKQLHGLNQRTDRTYVKIGQIADGIAGIGGKLDTLNETSKGIKENAEGIRDLLSQTGTLPPVTTTDSGQTTFDGVASAHMNALMQTPVMQSLTGITNIFPSSTSCPVIVVDLTATIIGQTFTSDIICDLSDEYLDPLLGPLMHIIFAINAFGIVMRA